MKAEKPAVGIMKTNDWGEARAYKIECVCGDSEHAHNVWVEADELGVTVTTYTMIKSKWWSMNRLQTIWKLLTKGYVEYEGSVIMTRQQALNYAETIKSAIADVETFRKKQNA
jgi:hydrogenase maturation factor